jgi:hypothetical protein
MSDYYWLNRGEKEMQDVRIERWAHTVRHVGAYEILALRKGG